MNNRNRFRIGQKATIINTSGHGFYYGDKVEIRRIGETCIECYGIRDDFHQYVGFEQVRIILKMNKRTDVL